MKIIILFYQWLLVRVPRQFSALLILFATLYYVFAFSWLAYQAGPRLAARLVRASNVGDVLRWVSPVQVLSASFTVAFAVFGIVLAYSLAAWSYRLTRSKRPPTYPLIEASEQNFPVDEGLLDRYQRIGIILAGGGAKGAYQAGSLTAIYQFLAAQDAMKKVKMIAGTSIGSWNALFWLADAIKPDCKCSIERWWTAMDVPSLIQPWPYLPLRQNFFLSTDPWREQFDSLFGQRTDMGQRLMRHVVDLQSDSLHFYFTRSNVAKARLEFTTNHHGIGIVPPNMPAVRPRPPVQPGTYDFASNLNDIKFAVFSSMDLPPLFRYTKRHDQYFEDGGVVENLPVRFGTEIEHCDLLFILPLNATFAEPVNHDSILRRFYRVMDVRQGVLERNAFKLIYLYNELAALRTALVSADGALVRMDSQLENLAVSSFKLDNEDLNRAKRRLGESNSVDSSQCDSPTDRAVVRKHQPIQVFSICPAPELAINTIEFWKTREAGQSFRLMYEATILELNRFNFRDPPPQVRMAMVSPFGEVTYFTDF